MIASHFSRTRHELRSNEPLSEEAMRRTAPSIFADGAHESRSERYAYIPTIDLVRGLGKEGFRPFMVAQTRVRDADQREHAKHIIRLRHANHMTSGTANEVILLNSHNGTSSYQMLSGVFRFVCANGLICGDRHHDIRIPHKGDVKDQVLDGANVILESFGLITEEQERMKAIQLDPQEAQVLARAALAVKYDDPSKPAPITEDQILRPRRVADSGSDLWSVFNRVQENLMKGGLTGRTANGRRRATRAVTGIDQGTSLNRALWTLAQGMEELKGR